jgi:hypothetical protein
MATAFSSSLFGLSGSIIITLMTLFLNRNLNAFIERLSYWTDLHLDNSPTRHASSLREQYISISAPDEIPSQGLPLRQNQSLGLNSTHEFSSDSGSSGLDAGMFEDHHYITSNLLEAIEEQLRQLRSDIRRNSRIIVTYVRSPVVMQYIDALKNILDKQTEQNSKGLHEALHLLAESQETQAQNMERLSRELANTVSSMKRSQQKMASSPDKIEE